MLKLCLAFMVAIHASVIHAQPGGGGTTPGGSGPVSQYDPHADTRFYCGHVAIEHISTLAFGWYDASASLDLWLTAPITAGVEDATGVNSAMQQFGIHFTSLVEVDSDNQVPTRLAWSWKGLFEGPLGGYPCSGLIIQDGNALRCVPLVAFRDEQTAYDIYEFLNDMQPRSICALDEIALHTLEQNLIEFDACRNEGDMFCTAAVIGVGVPAVAACATLPPSCIPGTAAILGVWIMREIWDYNMMNEWDRSMRQLCLDSKWRADHPDGPPPPSSQGEFECKKPLPLPW